MARKSRKGINYKTIQQQLESKTTKEPNGCWLKPIPKSSNGYVRLRITKDGKTKLVGAHRVSYELHQGPIPKGKFVMHTCDVRNCWNPEHLTIGTVNDNAMDCATKKRTRNGYSVKKLGKVETVK